MSSKIDSGLELISALDSIELKPIEIRNLLYKLISKDYNTIDEILEAAQKAKLIQRTKKTYLMTSKTSTLQFDKPKIVTREERVICKFCKKKLSTGYYVVFKSNTYGPYGSSCIRKMYLDYLL